MSAPAMKLRPAPIKTITLIAESALPRSTFSTMPSGTPGLNALTGGLSTVMTPIPSTFSKRTNAPSAMPSPPILKRCLCPEDDRALRRQYSAIAVRDRSLAIGDLARAAFLAQLPGRLDQQEQPIHAGVTIGQPAPIGVDRQIALGRNASIGHKAAAFALRAKADILEKQYRVDRERVVELDDIDVFRAEPGHCISGAARGQRPGHCQIRHARNIGMGDRLPAAEDINRRLL